MNRKPDMQARSSVAEHCPYVAGVGGSIPSAPKPWRGPAGLPAAMIMMLLAGCATTPAAAPGMHGNAAAEPAQYVIGPGDRLSIFVYDNPQLTAELPVRPDGRIST